jgi:hypothetical protein
VPRQPPPPVACVVRFVDAINAGDLDRLGSLMSEDHRLVVLDEAPLVGRAANVEAWRGYLSAFPDYVIYLRHVATIGSRVAVLGTTTGSHLGLVDDEEMALDVIWIAEVTNGTLSSWCIAADSPELRRQLGIPADA